MDWINQLKYDNAGLIPAIIQNINTSEILMLGYMNRESIHKTIDTGNVTFWSRSRNKFWTKGETSGNFLTLKEIYYDCDLDALLVKVIPKGPTCHTGNRTCFFKRVLLPQKPQ